MGEGSNNQNVPQNNLIENTNNYNPNNNQNIIEDNLMGSSNQNFGSSPFVKIAKATVLNSGESSMNKIITGLSIEAAFQRDSNQIFLEINLNNNSNKYLSVY